MTLKEAIENRTTYLKTGKIPKSSADYNATLLGIEACKRIQDIRDGSLYHVHPLLPGETED